MVLNTSSPAHTYWMGLALPTKYLAWIELLYLHVAVPQSSFLGHLAGILAGIRLWRHGGGSEKL